MIDLKKMTLAELVEYSQSEHISDSERELVLHEIRKKRVDLQTLVDLRLIRIRMNLIKG